MNYLNLKLLLFPLLLFVLIEALFWGSLVKGVATMGTNPPSYTLPLVYVLPNKEEGVDADTF